MPEILTIRDIPDDYTLVQNSQDIDAVAEHLGIEAVREYGCLFVRHVEGDYNSVYGAFNNVPYLDSLVDKIL